VPISTFLNGRDPSRLRGLQFLALSDVAVITRRTSTSDSGGGASQSWAAIGTAPCRVYPATAAPGRIVAGALDENTTHYCRLPAGTDVTAPDRIVVSGRGTFEVTLATTRTGEVSRLVEVMQTV
jgi:head-tail adaptor